METKLHLAQRFPSPRRRAAILLLLAIGIAYAASSDSVHSWLLGLLVSTEAIVRNRPVLGVIAFIALAATSAMLAFVSSAVIAPVAILVWGKAVSVLLLWTGWIIGGALAYLIGRYLGRQVVTALHRGSALDRYENTISNRAPFGFVLLFQVAVPSEVPGYLLGLARYPFWKYFIILLMVELPYAIATIYLGASFLERQTSLLIGLGAAVAAFSAWALYTLHRRITRNRG